MPVYDYKCQKCGRVFEKLVRSLSSAAAVTCEKCGSVRVKKLVSCCAISSGGKQASAGAAKSSHSCGSCSSHSCSTCH